MASENKTEYKVVADKIVSPDNNINLIVEGNVYVGASEAGNRVATISDVGSGGGGPLVVPVNIKDGNDENFITFSRTGTGTARIATPQDDLSLRSARDITLIAGDDGPGNVYIGWGDATIAPDATNRVATIADVESNTADFVFDTVDSPDYESTMTITNKDMVLKTVVDTEANGNIRVESAQDIVLNAGGDAYVGDSSSQINRIATMADVSSAGTGDITFVDTTISTDTGDDIIIENKDNNGIVKARITLDQGNEQVLIEAIDSSTNAFATGDWATATWSGTVIQITDTANGVIDFFNSLNGDVTHIQVNDGQLVQYDGAGYGPTDITINTVESAPAESDPVTITSLRFIYGVSSRINIDYDGEEFNISANGMDLNLYSSQEINLGSDDDIDLNAANRVRIYGDTNVFINSQNGGVFIGDSVENDNVNQVATLGDIEQAVETGPSEVSFTVNGGTDGTQPTFTGDPLFTGSYVKNGPLVHFQIQVDMDNITSFGTGQYYVTLPFPAKYGYKFREGCLHDISTGRDYAIGGHVYAGSSTLELSSTDTQSGTVFDIPFTATAPITLAVADNFHISGTYITE